MKGVFSMPGILTPEFEADLLHSIGTQTKRIRMILHMTQVELAEKAGHDLTAADIDRFERGEDDMFVIPFFHICAAMDVTPGDLAVEHYAETSMPEGFAKWNDKEREAALQVAAFHSVHRDWWMGGKTRKIASE